MDGIAQDCRNEPPPLWPLVTILGAIAARVCQQAAANKTATKTAGVGAPAGSGEQS